MLVFELTIGRLYPWEEIWEGENWSYVNYHLDRNCWHAKNLTTYVLSDWPFSLFDFAEIERTSECPPPVNFWCKLFSSSRSYMNPGEKDELISLTLFWFLVRDYRLREAGDWSSSIPLHLSMIRRDHYTGQLILWAVWHREETLLAIVSYWMWNFKAYRAACDEVTGMCEKNSPRWSCNYTVFKEICFGRAFGYGMVWSVTQSWSDRLLYRSAEGCGWW